MLHYDRNDISEGIDVNKTSASKGFFSLLYISDKGFMFEISCVMCHQFHDVLMMSIDLNSIGILSINGIDYRCIISRISKSGDIRLLKNVDLSEKSRSL